MNHENYTDKPLTYDELAMMIGYRMMTVIALMRNLGLTTLPHFVKSYFDPSGTDDHVLRDFERWMKWSIAPKNAEEREHLYPTDFVEICQKVLKG
jgi:predicted HAD superfamily phosphohydrolase YqeG